MLTKKEIQDLYKKGGPALHRALQACEDYLNLKKDDDVLMIKGLIIEDDNFFGYIAHQYKEEDALRCFKESVQLNPQNDRAWNAQGNYFFRRSDYPSALECYKKALELNPSVKEYRLNVRDCVKRMERGIDL